MMHFIPSFLYLNIQGDDLKATDKIRA